MRSSALFVAALLAVAVSAQDGRYQEILARHERSLGDACGLRTRCLYVLRTMRAGNQLTGIRTLVRPVPFGFRQELMPIEPPRAGLNRGERRPLRVAVAGIDARRRQGRAAGQPLRGETAMLILEQAFVEGFRYLDREWIARVANPPDVWTLPPWPGLPDEFEQQPRVQTIPFRTPAGSLLSFHFDAGDGRLHEISQNDVVPWWRIRFGGWKTFGGFRLPAARATEFLGSGAPSI
jgi:hypothetical protein